MECPEKSVQIFEVLECENALARVLYERHQGMLGRLQIDLLDFDEAVS